ncbi:MAG: AraC family transcriptional regulator [Methylibium sp. NZG]|nr:MAG: AraC family transcriptional regulator [Methylibium sp. NZG]
MLLALLALLAAVLARDRPRLPAARAGMAICLGLCVQVVGSTPMLEARLPVAWQAPLVAVAVGNAVLFWVFVQALFDDDFVFRPVHALAWGVVAVLSGFNCIVGPLHAVAPVTFGLQRAVPLLFAVLAAVAAAAQWRADLVEGRRRLRAFIVVTGVAYTLVMLVARLASPRGRLSATMASIDVVMLLFMMAVVAARLLHLGTSELFPLQALPRPAGDASLRRDAMPPSVEAAGPAETAAAAEAGLRRLPEPPAHQTPDPAEERLAAALHRLMHQERAYRTEDLTVAALAARLAVPEYRLRRHINQRLGHRNFNAYVNAFRLDDARAALADPAQREMPVLTIALEAGFQSIGPFNRAFKAATGVTPTEFRREIAAKMTEKLADS